MSVSLYRPRAAVVFLRAGAPEIGAACSPLCESDAQRSRA
jgi:hypothetical protein